MASMRAWKALGNSSSEAVVAAGPLVDAFAADRFLAERRGGMGTLGVPRGAAEARRSGSDADVRGLRQRRPGGLCMRSGVGRWRK